MNEEPMKPEESLDEAIRRTMEQPIPDEWIPNPEFSADPRYSSETAPDGAPLNIQPPPVDWLSQILNEPPRRPEPLPQESTDMATTKKIEVAMDGAKATVEVKAPPKKLCSLKDVLPESVIPLVKAAPNNETIRNLLLAHVKVSVPKEEDTFEKVKHWIEFNVNPPPRPKTALELALEQQERDMQRDAEREAERRRTQVMLQVSASEREHGRCSYHQDVKGEGQMPIDRARILRIAAGADNEDDFFDSIEQHLDEEGPGNHVSMSAVEESISHDDYETDESTDSNVTLSNAAKTALKEALRTANPELYDSIFGE